MSEGPSAAAARRQPRGVRGVTGAIILIAVGAALLLSNLGLISVQWYTLWRFWPVFLILVGLDLLLGRTVLGSLLAGLIGLAVVGGLLFIASDRYPEPVERPFGTTSITRDIIPHTLGDIDSAAVDLRIGVASVQVDALDDGDQLVSGTYTTDERLVMAEDYHIEGSHGMLTLSQESDNGEWAGPGVIGELDMHLTDQVPVDLNVSAGAGDLTLDLTGMQINSLRVDGGAGTIHLILPESGSFPVTVNGGVGTFEITVPDALEARLQVDGLTSVSVGPRFEKPGDAQVWQTADYDDNGADIHISAGLGTVNVH